MLSPDDFFPSIKNDPGFIALTHNVEYVWEILNNIKSFINKNIIESHTIEGIIEPGAYINNDSVKICQGAIIESGAYIKGPAYIGENVIVRHGAYIRDNAILMKGSIAGHATEIKNSILFPKACAPHFNYVGDSILGAHTNLGAGTKLSNLTILSEKDPVTGKRPTIKIQVDTDEYDTGLTKLGAILGDRTQTGCNSVLNPGCLVGPNSLLYANISLRKGYYPPNSLIKLRQTTERTIFEK